MQRLRSLHHKNRYTQLANDAIDTLPDLESIGLLATILRHSDEFDFQMSVLIKSKPGLGADRAYKARKTLVKHGYVVQVKFKHTYRGRFCTDIYRSAEPHTEEDLELLRQRYAPGQTTSLVDEDGQERLVTITWAELTSALGAERINNEPPVDNSAEEEPPKPSEATKQQVAPDTGFPGSGQPGSGQPGSGRPDPGQPGSLKENRSEESERENPDPDARARDGRTDESSSEVAEKELELARVIEARLDLQRIDAKPKQVQQIRQAIAEALARGVEFATVARHAEVKLREANTCRYFIAGFGPDYLSAAPEAAPAAAELAPEWCGHCDPEGRERPNLRRIEDASGVMRRCPTCHPAVLDATSAQ